MMLSTSPSSVSARLTTLYSICTGQRCSFTAGSRSSAASTAFSTAVRSAIVSPLRRSGRLRQAVQHLFETRPFGRGPDLGVRASVGADQRGDLGGGLDIRRIENIQVIVRPEQ